MYYKYYFDEFLSIYHACTCIVWLQVKEIEKRDAVLTSAQQIDRLLRPGSKYINLNPFEVMMLLAHSQLFTYEESGGSGTLMLSVVI